jgi:gliding motility-associated-like protein
MRYIFSILLLLISSNVSAQSFLMSDPDFDMANPLPCALYGATGIVNFFDAGAAANYPSNSNEVITICPDNSINVTYGYPYAKLILTFAINVGFTFDIHSSDTLFVYDGPTIASPLMGAINSSTNPTGAVFISSFANTSGCLTLRFKSDGANEGTGWGGSMTCFTPNQPFESHMFAYVNGVMVDQLSPADTGYVDVCLGDTILFVANPLFPNSAATTGVGYLQTAANSTYQWAISGSGIVSTTPTATFIPSARVGYLVDLKVTDVFPVPQTIRCKVRVSQLPSFATCGPLLDSICLGDVTSLVGGVTVTDTAGVDIPPSFFQLGGSVSGTTFLPDGTGAVYNTSINISGFPAGAVFNNINSINQICLDMEHSYIGDIEIALTCPNGTIVSLMNAYNVAGGLIPGGFGNGISTYLGNANDLSAAPGSGLNYCFSAVSNTFQTIGVEDGLGTWIQAGNPLGNTMDPNGVYLPDGNFADFIGCPINGNWTITVQDNQSVDDGWIYNWSIFFDASLQPGLEGYQNTVVTENWTASPFITGGTGDTLISVNINTVGVHPFTYNIVDDFGCHYDTTVNVTVIAQPTIFNDTTLCSFNFAVIGTTALTGGVWSTTTPGNVSFSNVNINNPNITLNAAGTFPVTFTDNFCGTSITSDITINPSSQIMGDTTFCGSTLQVSGTVSPGGGIWSVNNPLLAPYVSFSNTSALNPLITFTQQGDFPITFTDTDCGVPVTFFAHVRALPSIFPSGSTCFLTYQITGTTSSGGGVWSSSNAGVSFSNTTLANPLVTLPSTGIYTVSFTDNVCHVTQNAIILVPDTSFLFLNDTLLCINSSGVLQPVTGGGLTSYLWSTGETTPSILVSQTGVYSVTGSNACHTYTDNAFVTTELCDFEAPNIITPNGDNVNELFLVTGNGMKSFNCKIFNRWGSLLYEYDTLLGSWDAKVKGVPVVDGTYFYLITATTLANVAIERQGFFQVAR